MLGWIFVSWRKLLFDLDLSPQNQQKVRFFVILAKASIQNASNFVVKKYILNCSHKIFTLIKLDSGLRRNDDKHSNDVNGLFGIAISWGYLSL
jgi:hypothetical protein